MSSSQDEVNRNRLAKWARFETSSRTSAVVGRNTGGSTAVTGHASKPRGGDGSFKAPRDSAAPSAVVKPNKISREASVLAKAVLNRRDKFEIADKE